MSSEITNSTLAAQIQSLIQSWQTREKQLQTWLGGTVGGGDSSNGTYPLSDYLGNTQYVECPAQLADDVTNTVDSATTQATAAAASAAAAAASATSAATASTLAGTYATNAAASATLAYSYSNAAGTYQAAALASENAADSSATDADTSATDAATSASDAATSATAAASSASDASTSASDAASSASAAAASATAAAASAPLPSITGESGKFLTNNGSTVSWAELTIPSAAGSNTQIQYNDDGDFAASADLTWNGSTLQVTNSNSSYPITSPSLILQNTSSSAQTTLDFYYNTSTLNGRIRNDYAGNLNYVAYQAGQHIFYISGDADVGTPRLFVNGSTLEFVSNTAGPATGIYCEGDITAARSDSATEGAVFLGSGGSYYIASAPLGSFSYGTVYTASGSGGYGGFIAADGYSNPTLMANGSGAAGIYCQGPDRGGWLIAYNGSLITLDYGPYGGNNLPVYIGGQVNANAGGSASIGIVVRGNNATAGTAIEICDQSGTINGYIEYSTPARTVTLVSASDASLKENIETAADPGALIDRIKVRSFDWKDNKFHIEYGFVAQELDDAVSDHIPGLVSKQRPNEFGVAEHKLVPLMMAELKSLRARVLNLEST